MKNISILALFLLTSIFFISCAGQKLDGKYSWYMNELNFGTIEFSTEGTFLDITENENSRWEDFGEYWIKGDYLTLKCTKRIYYEDGVPQDTDVTYEYFYKIDFISETTIVTSYTETWGEVHVVKYTKE